MSRTVCTEFWNDRKILWRNKESPDLLLYLMINHLNAWITVCEPAMLHETVKKVLGV